MGWLVTHMWGLMLASAFLGGVIGWLWRGWGVGELMAERDADLLAARRANEECESEKRRLRDQISGRPGAAVTGDAKKRIAELEKELADAKAGGSEAEGLAWRNRYLQSRVSYLEERLTALGEEPGGSGAPGTPSDAPAQALGLAGGATAAATSAGATLAEKEPERLAAPSMGAPDDLKKIKGVGPKLEATLHELGFFYYRQIAAWTAEEVAWVDTRLSFKGRIQRDNWIEQAKILAAGGETEFSKRS